jgi:hypothetical protein
MELFHDGEETMHASPVGHAVTTPPATPVAPTPAPAATDSDGDHDGSTIAAAKPPGVGVRLDTTA